MIRESFAEQVVSEPEARIGAPFAPPKAGESERGGEREFECRIKNVG